MVLFRNQRLVRLVVLWAGWLLPQVLLLGPCLLGHRILAPAQLLQMPGVYTPLDGTASGTLESHPSLSDIVLVTPGLRRFVAEELRAGRIPYWQPRNFCGAPFSGYWCSPLELLHAAFPAPATLAWRQVIEAVIFASGTWWFATRSLRFPFWISACLSWIAPWIGFITLWQCFPLTSPVIFLPWLLRAVDALTMRPDFRHAVSLALLSLLTIVSGALDLAGLVLLTVGLRLLERVAHRTIEFRSLQPVIRPLGLAAVAWTAAFLIAMPFLLPFMEAVRDGSRMQARSAGASERPPEGLHALSRVGIPEIDGGSRAAFPWIAGRGNLLESSAGAFVGLLLLLTFVPLALVNRSRHPELVFWGILLLLSLAWCLNLPGLVSVMKLPGLRMLSFNRWTFASAWALLMLGGAGLETLQTAATEFRRLRMPFAAISAGLTISCLIRMVVPGELITVSLPEAIRSGSFPWLTAADIPRVVESFRHVWLLAGSAAGIALIFWLMCRSTCLRSRWFRGVVCGLLVLEPWYFACLQTRQCAPHDYFPPVPALQFLAEQGEGRVLGVECLPPQLNAVYGLRDIRGYDAIDPARIVNVLKRAEEPGSINPPYAATQYFRPRLVENADGRTLLPPILNLLNTRFLIFRRPPPPIGPILFQEADYWVVENPNAMPRVFVPSRVEVASDMQALAAMEQWNFDPEAVGYLQLEEAHVFENSRGAGSVIREQPCEIEISATMETPGVLVLSDSWHPGWSATVNGQPQPILRCNTAVRGVALPAGTHRVVMRFRPVTLPLGQGLAAAGCMMLIAMLIVARRQSAAVPLSPSTGS
jgi:hypothetical protein